METRKINRPVFDMLRSAAVIMVFTIHFLEHRNIPVPHFLFEFFRHCGSGVAFFFVISGYLIMQSLENSKSTKEYFIKRVTRIIPSYYTVLIIGIVVWDLLLHNMPSDSLLHIGWLRYFLFLNSLVPSNEYMYWNNLWGLWTMSCFMLFYLLAPLVKRYVKSFRGSLVLLLLTFVFAYAFKFVYTKLLLSLGFEMTEFLVGDGAVFNLTHFALGVTAFYAIRDGKDKEYLSIIMVLLFAVLVVREDTYNRVILSLIAVAFMLAMKDFEYSNKTKWIGNILSFVSQYSFCIYLVHLFVLQLTDYLFSKNFAAFNESKGTYYIPFLLVTVLGSFLLAFVLRNLVEKPFAKLIKRMGTR